MNTKMYSAFAALALLFVCGCQGQDPAQTDNKSMRDTMTSNKPFDINNVPPENRAMVLKMRGGAGASRPGADAAPRAAGTPSTNP